MLLLLENQWAHIRVPPASLRGRNLPASGVPLVQGLLLAPLVGIRGPHLGHGEGQLGLILLLLGGKLGLVVSSLVLLLLGLQLRAAAEALDVVREESLLGAETQRVREGRRVLGSIGDYYLIEGRPKLIIITLHAAAGTRRALGLRILPAIHWGISHDTLVSTRFQRHLNVTCTEIILQALGNIEGVWSATHVTLMQIILLLYG